MDTNAGWFYSYTFCPTKNAEACISDYWNYVSPQCEETPIDGWQVDIDRDCKVDLTTDKFSSFDSSILMVGQSTTR